jgi:predicted nucleotidyltransferase
MSVSAEPVAAEERLNLLDALIYGDVFGCAVTLDELWRYARVAIGRDELRHRLSDDPVLRRIVVEQDGLFCLDGRTALLDKRSDRIRRARRLQRRARRVACVLRHLPFVDGLILTGSTSADDASEQADIDLLVIVAPGRLGTAFLLLGSTSRLLRRRLFCPNWYVHAGRLGIAPGSIYIAREFAQARSLVGSADPLRDSNPWLVEFFPNAIGPPTLDRTLKGSTPLQRLLEAPLRGAVGDRLEGFGRRVAVARLRAHYTGLDQDVPAEVAASLEAGLALRFHGYRFEERTVEAYAAQRARVMARLEQAERELGRATNRSD